MFISRRSEFLRYGGEVLRLRITRATTGSNTIYIILIAGCRYLVDIHHNILRDKYDSLRTHHSTTLRHICAMNSDYDFIRQTNWSSSSIS